MHHSLPPPRHPWLKSSERILAPRRRQNLYSNVAEKFSTHSSRAIAAAEAAAATVEVAAIAGGQHRSIVDYCVCVFPSGAHEFVSMFSGCCPDSKLYYTHIVLLYLLIDHRN